MAKEKVNNFWGSTYLVLLWTVVALVSCDLLVGMNAFETLSSIAVIMTSCQL